MKKFSKRKQVNCQVCGTPFQVPFETYNKNIKDNKPFYCSPICSSQQETPKLVKVKTVDDIFSINYKIILATNEPIRISITDIKEQWNNQKGLCHVSLVELSSDLEKDSINTPMLLKKVKNKEYTKDNIIWVCKPIGILMNTFNDDIYDILNELTVDIDKPR